MPQYISYPIITSGSSSTVPAQTSGAMALWVSTTGSDNLGDGSQLNPFLTLQKAVTMIPKQVNHRVEVNVGAGTFVGFNLEGVSINTLGTDATGIHFIGTLGTSTIASGLTTGTIASATAGTGDSVTWGTATVTGAGWTVDDLRGRFIRIDAGTGIGQIRPIASNTATVITVAGNWTAPTGATFTIVEPTTILNNNPNPQIGGSQIYIQGCQGGTELAFIPDRAAVHVTRMNFASGNRGIRFASNIRAKFENLKFGSTTAGIVAIGTGGRLEVLNSVFGVMTVGLQAEDLSLVLAQRCLFLGCATGFLETSSQLTAIGMGSNSVSNMNYYRACTTQAIFVNGVMAISGDIIDAVTPGSRIGILSSGIAGFTRINTSNISNCAAAIQATGTPGRFISLIGVVASPTTVFNDAGGAGNTTAFLLTRGVNVQVSSTSTITGTSELSIDGTVFTMAQMRAATPKAIRHVEYGTVVYE